MSTIGDTQGHGATRGERTSVSSGTTLSGEAATQFEAVRRALINRRTELGISMSELARQIGVSPSMISQIERGQSLPSVATLFALAHALGAKVDAFFEDGDGDSPPAVPPNGQPRHMHLAEPRPRPVDRVNDLYVVHSDSRTGIDISGGVRWERLTPVPLEQIEFLELLYEPQAESDPELYSHPGIEMTYVVCGRFNICIGTETHELSEGDSIAFPSSLPHRYTNPTDQTSRAITLILHEPIGEASAPAASVVAGAADDSTNA